MIGFIIGNTMPDLVAFATLKASYSPSDQLKSELRDIVRREFGPLGVIGEINFVNALPQDVQWKSHEARAKSNSPQSGTRRCVSNRVESSQLRRPAERFGKTSLDLGTSVVTHGCDS